MRLCECKHPEHLHALEADRPQQGVADPTVKPNKRGPCQEPTCTCKEFRPRE